MGLIALGLNHQTAPVELREKFSVHSNDIDSILENLLEGSGISEAVVLSTCNRTELYFAGETLPPALRRIRKHIDIPIPMVKNHAYLYGDELAVTHLMRVASGLDSMVLGEAEILGQIKHAFQCSKDNGAIGKLLDRLFQYTFQTAKLVRSSTEIGINPVSVAYTAVSLSKHLFSDIKSAKVLVIGAGDTARLILKHLQSMGVRQLMLANRTLAHAEILAQEVDPLCQLELLDLQSLSAKLYQADIVISSTASQLPVLGKGMVESALKLRKRRPIFMVDIAVPRDIEPEVGLLSDVYLYTIDDLQDRVEEHQALRRNAAMAAQLIIEREVENFMAWWRAQQDLQVVKQLRANALELKEEILSEGLRKLAQGKPASEVLQATTHQMLNRLLHQPTVEARKASFTGDQTLLAAICQLFNLTRNK